MKNFSYFFTALGMCLVLFTLYIMFNPSEFQDKDFVLALFSGISVTFIGFTIETHQSKVDSRFQREHRAKQLRSCYTVLTLSTVMFVISLIWL